MSKLIPESYWERKRETIYRIVRLRWSGWADQRWNVDIDNTRYGRYFAQYVFLRYCPEEADYFDKDDKEVGIKVNQYFQFCCFRKAWDAEHGPDPGVQQEETELLEEAAAANAMDEWIYKDIARRLDALKI